MTVTVTLTDATHAVVRFERLFGIEVRYLEAVMLPSIGGGVVWVWDATGRPVKERRVLEALERAQVRNEAERRIARIERRQ